MATDRQIRANQLNARKSTGPRTLPGKARSRLNALTHGLTAQTVVDVIEDADEFRVFAAEVAAGYRITSPFQRELIRRLTSLLWRLRRAHAVETGLFNIHARLQRERQAAQASNDNQSPLRLFCPDQMLAQDAAPAEAHAKAFLRMCNLSGGAFDRLSRYEITIWRQILQIHLLLENGSLYGPSSAMPVCETKPIPAPGGEDQS